MPQEENKNIKSEDQERAGAAGEQSGRSGGSADGARN
jgi:hypothetical protein